MAQPFEKNNRKKVVKLKNFIFFSDVINSRRVTVPPETGLVISGRH